MKAKSRSNSLSLVVRDYIKDYIVEHHLKAGDPLPPEGQIADELGVSRSPVREAVKALQSLGIVETRHGEGLFVREWNFDPVLETLSFGMRVSPVTLEELYEIRIWLEMAVIGDVVRKISDDQIVELDILMLQWTRAARAGEDYIKYDEEFHRIILGIMENTTLLKLFSAFWVAFHNYKDADLYSPDLDRVLLEHQQVVDAIKQRDPKLARRMLAKQFAGFKDRIHQIIEGTQSEADKNQEE